jgi:hypothetical protein
MGLNMMVNPKLDNITEVGRKERSKFRLPDRRCRYISASIIIRESNPSCTLLNPDKRYKGVSSKMNFGSKAVLKKKINTNFTKR